MNMVQLMLDVILLERELDIQQQNYRVNAGADNMSTVARKPKKKRYRWFFDRLRRVKPFISLTERVAANQNRCRTENRPLDPVVCRCSTLDSGGLK